MKVLCMRLCMQIGKRGNVFLLEQLNICVVHLELYEKKFREQKCYSALWTATSIGKHPNLKIELRWFRLSGLIWLINACESQYEMSLQTPMWNVGIHGSWDVEWTRVWNGIWYLGNRLHSRPTFHRTSHVYNTPYWDFAITWCFPTQQAAFERLFTSRPTPEMGD